jgi:transcriptional regulator with XRE-family HTH domain
MREHGYSLRAVADRMTSDGRGTVGHSSVSAWADGTRRPGRENCVRIARVFRADPRYVLDLAGWPAPEEGTYILEATLTDEEQAIIEAYRTGDPRTQAPLLAIARASRELRGRSDAVPDDAAGA